MHSIWNDPDFIQHVGDRGIHTENEARQALADGALTAYRESGFGPFHVSLKDGRAIGICGLFEREELDHPDLGFALLPAFRRKGFAEEAARAVLQYCDNALHLPGVYAIVAPANFASIALIERLGMRLTRRLRMNGDDDDVSLYFKGFRRKDF